VAPTSSPSRSSNRFGRRCKRELLDTTRWETKHHLSQAIFECIEAWYDPRRRHTSIGDLSPVAYEHHTVGDAESAA
jgi:transposase InsO family protein